MAKVLLLTFRRVSSVSLLRTNPLKSTSLYSTMSRLLIEEPKYSWLQELGLKADNPGVFCGTWSGQGQVSTLTHLLRCKQFCEAFIGRRAVIPDNLNGLV